MNTIIKISILTAICCFIFGTSNSFAQAGKKTETFKKQVRASHYIRELSQGYDAKEIDQLVDSIVRKKVELLGNAEYLSTEWDEFHLQYVEYAHRLLDLILGKKLFNLELQWRAEEITLPGVEITSDFRYWANHLWLQSMAA